MKHLCVLRMNVVRDRSRRLLGLSQRSYIYQVFKRFNMKKFSSSETPTIKDDKYLVSQSLITVEYYSMQDIPMHLLL